MSAVKFAEGAEDVVDILAIPFGGPKFLGGRDTDGEFFSKNTDLCLDWFPDSRPVLFDHGFDPELGAAVVGRADSKTLRQADDGWWVKAQLDRRHRYFEALKRLIQHGALSGSSQALTSLVRRAKSGELLRWPWVEETLTPIPANLLSVIEPALATKHFKELGLDAEALGAMKAAWDTAYVNDLPDSAFAWIEPGGSKDDEGKTVPRSLRHFPHHDSAGAVDLPHLRNALARVAQGSYPASVATHLESHAKAEGVGEAGAKKLADSLTRFFGAVDALDRAVPAHKESRVLSGGHVDRLKHAHADIGAVLAAHDAAMSRRGGY